MTRRDRLEAEALALFADPARFAPARPGFDPRVAQFTEPNLRRRHDKYLPERVPDGAPVDLVARYAAARWGFNWSAWGRISSTAATIREAHMPACPGWCNRPGQPGHAHPWVGYVEAPCGCVVPLADWWRHELRSCERWASARRPNFVAR